MEALEHKIGHFVATWKNLLFSGTPPLEIKWIPLIPLMSVLTKDFYTVQCTTTPLHYYTNSDLHHYTTTTMHHCTTTPLHHYTATPAFLITFQRQKAKILKKTTKIFCWFLKYVGAKWLQVLFASIKLASTIKKSNKLTFTNITTWIF